MQGLIRFEPFQVIWEKRIAILNHLVHFGKVKFLAIFQGKRIELATPYDEQNARTYFYQYLIKRAEDLNSLDRLQ